MTQATWYDTQRVSQPGSVVLAKWNAERQAVKNEAARSISTATAGSEVHEWLTGGAHQYVAGVPVNEKTAMRVSAVYAAVSLIGGAVSNMPLDIYRGVGDDAVKANQDSKLFWLFNEELSPAWSAPVAWEFSMSSLMLHGDSMWRILRASPVSPDIVGFEPWNPLAVWVQRVRGRLVYTMVDPDGQVFVLDQDDVLHVPGVGFDGLRGMSPIRHAALRSAVGVAHAADGFAASFFSNGARPDFALTTDGKLSDEAVKILRDTWEQRHSGTHNAHKPAVLTGGLKVQQLTMTSQDAQLLDTRKFQIEDIARIYGVPPHMIGSMDKTSAWGTGIEQLSISFVRYTLMRHLVKFQAEINRKCFRTGRYSARFDAWGLEKGDLSSLFTSLRVAVGRAGEPGLITINEARAKAGMPKVPGGDKLFDGGKGNASTDAPDGAQQK
ncbi:phage portal protein [Amantichitinum ursilacus]|uniref:Phage portal protein n=1 Tax=Amantichitinum ursilacus TaxID=857265 RepID=A0A0N0XK77_9NEIS|nr:phage portal protein [Amantichitinum ursilacus]KPC53018.1 Phage portal protein [Amantichitinum ursilacus]